MRIEQSEIKFTAIKLSQSSINMKSVSCNFLHILAMHYLCFTFAAQLATAFNAVVPISSVKISSTLLNAEVDKSRRSVFTALVASASLVTSSAGQANAVYGADAKMELPNIAQGIADRTNKQCLVESLGNRECLVYEDPENKLYKNADSKILFERLNSSVDAMKRLPTYITNKQWSNVQSVLTGPMGSLSSTMNELVKLIDEESPVKNDCKQLSVAIRQDLYEIKAMVDRKDAKQAQASADKAEKKLEKFMKLISTV